MRGILSFVGEEIFRISLWNLKEHISCKTYYHLLTNERIITFAFMAPAKIYSLSGDHWRSYISSKLERSQSLSKFFVSWNVSHDSGDLTLKHRKILDSNNFVKGN